MDVNIETDDVTTRQAAATPTTNGAVPTTVPTTVPTSHSAGGQRRLASPHRKAGKARNAS